jgi:hypothetical protein
MPEEGTRATPTHEDRSAEAERRARVVPGTGVHGVPPLTVGEAADHCAWGLHAARAQTQLALDALDRHQFKAAKAAFLEAAKQVGQVQWVCEAARDGGVPVDGR